MPLCKELNVIGLTTIIHSLNIDEPDVRYHCFAPNALQFSGNSKMSNFVLTAFANVISRVVDAEMSSKMETVHSSSASSFELPISTNDHSYSHAALQLVNSKERQFRLNLKRESICMPLDIFSSEKRRTAVADCIFRNFCSLVIIMQSSGADIPIATPTTDQFVHHRSDIDISPLNGDISVTFRVLKMSNERAHKFLVTTFPMMIQKWLLSCQVDMPAVTAYWHCIEDQCILREMVSAVGVSFVANGSILPRAGNYLYHKILD